MSALQPWSGAPRRHCIVGCGYAANGKHMSPSRLAGRWMEELDFAISKKLHVRVRDDELVVSLATED